MAEAQLGVDEELETLTMSDILVMTVDELRNELYKRDKLPEGTANIPEPQMALLNPISVPITSKTSRPAPPYPVTAPTQSVRFDPSRDTLGVTKRLSPVRAPTELSSGSVELQLQLRRLELKAKREERREHCEMEEQERRERYEARQQQQELQMKCSELGVPLFLHRRLRVDPKLPPFAWILQRS